MPSSPVPSTPRYVRVARALALITGLAGLSACGDTTTAPPSDSGTRADASADLGARADLGREPDSGSEADLGATTDSGASTDSGTSTDSGADVDLGGIADGGGIDASAISCETCVCTGLGPDSDAGPVVSCEHVGRFDCCVAIGPLFPPDLPA